MFGRCHARLICMHKACSIQKDKHEHDIVEDTPSNIRHKTQQTTWKKTRQTKQTHNPHHALNMEQNTENAYARKKHTRAH